MVRIRHLYISPGHNFFGHHGKPAGTHEVVEVEEVQCLAGRGLAGDRFLDYKTDYKGQITFFAWETFQELAEAVQVKDRAPGVLRRNVITEGLDLLSLIGVEFSVQGVQFEGMQECAPCYWMDQAFGPGSEEYLKGRGGLRAKICKSGMLKAEGKELRVES